MPNWCDNELRLTNVDVKKIKALVNHLDGGGALFEHLRPNPDPDWSYSWCCENWGTKWDVTPSDYEIDDEYIVITFDSAWSPPVTLYEYLTDNGWAVDARYLEEGCGFCGTYSSELGEDYHDYVITDEESVKKLPQDLIEFGNIWERHCEYMADLDGEDNVGNEMWSLI